jgi:asparagine synthase (glutamine-hydrolysing)
MTGATLPPLERYARWAAKVKREVRELLYFDPELLREQNLTDEAMLAPYFQSQQNCSELSRLLYIGTKTELPSDMLQKVDRMSMAASLEVRSPFLDHQLFEYAATLHDDAKLNKWTTKYALRKIAKQLLPAEVVDRKKRGFSVPLDRWLREDRGIFDNITIRSLIDEHFDEQCSRARELWTLMTIEVWQRNYIDQFVHYVDNPDPLPIVSPVSAS